MGAESELIDKLLEQNCQGSAKAKNMLAKLLDDRFRRQASWLLRHEPPGISLGTTEVMHEAWLRLLTYDELAKAKNHNELFRAFARAMRQALVDYARRRRAERRGGDRRREGSDVLLLVEDIRPNPIDVLVVDEAFGALTAEDARAAEVMAMRVFGGYQVAEIAEALGVAPSTVERDFRFGRHFLRRYLSRAGPS